MGLLCDNGQCAKKQQWQSTLPEFILPEFMYQWECVALDNPVTITSAQHAGAKATETVDDQIAEDDTADEELVDEFDPSSDEEIEETTDESALVLQGTLQGEIGSAANFLLGARSRFGRVIRFNNRLLYWKTVAFVRCCYG